jgi:hypothetical protein
VSDWQSLDTAPKDKKLLLFCPWVDSPDGTGGHPEAKVNHHRIVGWWSADLNHWASSYPGGEPFKVYPSRWTDLPDEPAS